MVGETSPTLLVTFTGPPCWAGDGCSERAAVLAAGSWRSVRPLGPRLPPPRSRSAISRFLAGLEAAQMEAPEPASRHASAAPSPVAPALTFPALGDGTNRLPDLHQRKPQVWWLMSPASFKPTVIQPLPARPPTLSLPGLGDHQVLPSSPIPTAQGSLQSPGGMYPTTSCLPTRRVSPL